VIVPSGISSVKPDLNRYEAFLGLIDKMHAHPALSMPGRIRIQPVSVAGQAGFKRVVFSTFLSKGPLSEYPRWDIQSNNVRRKMHFIVAIQWPGWPRLPYRQKAGTH
jgi:hypothetical protein